MLKEPGRLEGTASSVLHNPQVKIYFKHPQEGQLLPISIRYYSTQSTLAQASMAKVVPNLAVRLLGGPLSSESFSVVTLKRNQTFTHKKTPKA